MIPLSDRWLKELSEQPEAGIGYQVVSIILKDDRRYDRVVIDSGFVTKVKGMHEIPFKEEDVHKILVIHDMNKHDPTYNANTNAIILRWS
jgi:hypothetical protein